MWIKLRWGLEPLSGGSKLKHDVWSSILKSCHSEPLSVGFMAAVPSHPRGCHGHLYVTSGYPSLQYKNRYVINFN